MRPPRPQAPRPRARLPLLLLLFCLLPAAAARAQQPSIPPAPTRWVTDTAGLLSPQTRAELDARLQGYERRTGHQLIVWVGRSTGGVPLEEWSARVFEAWGVGRKGLDDGMALFVFAEDRRLRIEVGYDLEDEVPDALAARLIREVAVPHLRAGQPDEAVRGTVEALMAATGDPEARAVPGPAPRTPAPQPLSPAQKLVGGVLAALLLFFFLTHPRAALFLLFHILAGGGGRGRGGGWGGGGGGGFSGGGGRSGGGGASGSW